MRALKSTFENIEDGEKMQATMLCHHNGVAQTFEEAPGQYRPLLEMDKRNGGVVWKPWILGFARAVRMRPTAWARIESSKELDVQETLLVTQRLFDAANGTSEQESKPLGLPDKLAPMPIGGVVRDLYADKKSWDWGAPERLWPMAICVPQHIHGRDAETSIICVASCGTIGSMVAGTLVLHLEDQETGPDTDAVHAAQIKHPTRTIYVRLETHRRETELNVRHVSVNRRAGKIKERSVFSEDLMNVVSCPINLRIASDTVRLNQIHRLEVCAL